MKLSYSQKQWVGDLCEKASDLQESVSEDYRVCWSIDQRGQFCVTLLSATPGGTLNIMAKDYVQLFQRNGDPNEGCLLALQEIAECYRLATENGNKRKAQRIAVLETELATLKAQEA